jgi:hypothetical protein
MKRLLLVLSLVVAQAFAQETPRGVIRGLSSARALEEAVSAPTSQSKQRGGALGGAASV